MKKGGGNILWSAVTEEGRSFWRKIFSFSGWSQRRKSELGSTWGFPSHSFAHRKLLQPFGQGIPELVTTTNSFANILILPNWAKISNWAAKHSQTSEIQVFLRYSQTEVLKYLCFISMFLTILCCQPNPRIPSHNMYSSIPFLWALANWWQCLKKTCLMGFWIQGL